MGIRQGDKLKLISANKVNAWHPTEDRPLKIGDVVEATNEPKRMWFYKIIGNVGTERVSEYGIHYNCKSYGQSAVPLSCIELIPDPSKGCSCSVTTLWTTGCECGRVV